MEKIFKALHLIHLGEYSRSLVDLDEPWKSLIHSRIFELNGRFEEALSTAHEIVDCEVIEMAFSKIAMAYANWRLNNKSESIINTNHASDLLESGKGRFSEFLISVNKNICGLIYWKEGLELKYALNLLEESLVIREKLGFKIDESYTINNIGNTYLKMGDLEKGAEYFKKAFKIRKKLGYPPSLAASENSFGRYYDAKKNYEKALVHHQKSLNIWKLVNNKQFIGKSLRFIGTTQIMMGDKEKGLERYSMALDTFEKIKNSTDVRLTKKMMLSIN